VDDNRISGTTRNLGGKVEEGLGRLSGDVGAQVRGRLDQAGGSRPGHVRSSRRCNARNRLYGRRLAMQHDRNATLHDGTGRPWNWMGAGKVAEAYLITGLPCPEVRPEMIERQALAIEH
jgi:hypothetical protein